MKHSSGWARFAVPKGRSTARWRFYEGHWRMSLFPALLERRAYHATRSITTYDRMTCCALACGRGRTADRRRRIAKPVVSVPMTKMRDGVRFCSFRAQIARCSAQCAGLHQSGAGKAVPTPVLRCSRKCAEVLPQSLRVLGTAELQPRCVDCVENTNYRYRARRRAKGIEHSGHLGRRRRVP